MLRPRFGVDSAVEKWTAFDTDGHPGTGHPKRGYGTSHVTVRAKQARNTPTRCRRLLHGQNFF